MSAAASSITYNILLMPRGGNHYVKAGQKMMTTAPERDAVIDLVLDDRTIAATVEHIHTPPGCDEHCIGTLFTRER